MVIFSILFLMFAGSLESQILQISVSAESAILMNADSGALLYEKKSHAKLYPASITKIATVAYVLELKGDSDLAEMIAADQDCIGSVTEEAKIRSNYTLPSYWLVTDCSHIGIKKGEILSMRDLLFGIMIASADDASNIVAQKMGNGSIPTFMDGLNRYLKRLGCEDTFFNNPHGLHHPKHVTTAYDMAIITKEALKSSKFREMAASTRYTRPKTNKQEPTVLVQTNKLLRTGEFHYPRAFGVKTGRTSKAGNTFVAAAKNGDRTLIAVLMNAKERKDIFKDAIRLFDSAFMQEKIEKNFIQAGPQRHSLEIEGADKLIKSYTLEDALLAYYPAEEPKIKAYLQWDAIELPVIKGQKIGEVQLKTDDQQVIKTVSLYAEENVDASLLFKIKQASKGRGAKVLVVLGILGLLLICIIFISRRSSR